MILMSSINMYYGLTYDSPVAIVLMFFSIKFHECVLFSLCSWKLTEHND